MISLAQVIITNPLRYLPLNPIIGPVQIIVAPADVNVNGSQSVTVACVAKGVPHPNITWLHNGNPVGNSSMHIIRERVEDRGVAGMVTVGTLELCPALMGEYTCMAHNLFMSTNVSFTVVTDLGLLHASL